MVFGCALLTTELGAQPAEGKAAPGEEDAVATEIQTLERQIESELVKLATGDCTVACLALESMVRAADRLCELAPGPKCDDAKSKVADAKRRVNQSCPECEASRSEQAVTPDQPAPPEPVDMASEDEPAPASPPAEEARGGCAACAINGQRDASIALLAALAALGLTLLRRRRSGFAPRR